MNNSENLFSIFQKIALSNKSKTAIIQESNYITYGDLLNKVNFISKKLIQYKKEEKNTVAILLEPSIDFIAVMLACLETGIAYIPLDISYPDVHIKNILSDSEVKILLSQKNISFDAPLSIEIIYIDDLESSETNTKPENYNTTANDTAYIIYTSGSTGSPKGVVITQQGLVNLSRSTQKIYCITPEDRIPLVHSLAFDFSIWEILSSLLNGATLIIPSDLQKKSLDSYIAFLRANNITILNMTPAMLYLLIDGLENIFSSNQDSLKLRLIILGGDALKPIKIKNWFTLPLSKKANIFNMYGITEGTIHSTFIKVTKEMTLSSLSLIGTPLEEIGIAILNEEGDEIEEKNTAGELCLIGASVAKKYLKNPQLTAEKFFLNKENQLCFRTGDLVQKNSENQLVYLGRKDNRLKIRGFRVDPLEIENALLCIEGITNALILSQENNQSQKELIGFIEDKNKIINLSIIKEQLKKQLPDYMIPTRLLAVEEFPLNINGKIDKNELLKKIEPFKPYKPTSNLSDEKEKIIKLWEFVLESNNINDDQNFFDAGGNSLLLMKLHFHIQKNINPNITLMDLIENPSINKLSKFIRNKETKLAENLTG